MTVDLGDDRPAGVVKIYEGDSPAELARDFVEAYDLAGDDVEEALVQHIASNMAIATAKAAASTAAAMAMPPPVPTQYHQTDRRTGDTLDLSDEEEDASAAAAYESLQHAAADGTPKALEMRRVIGPGAERDNRTASRTSVPARGVDARHAAYALYVTRPRRRHEITVDGKEILLRDGAPPASVFNKLYADSAAREVRLQQIAAQLRANEKRAWREKRRAGDAAATSARPHSHSSDSRALALPERQHQQRTRHASAKATDRQEPSRHVPMLRSNAPSPTSRLGARLYEEGIAASARVAAAVTAARIARDAATDWACPDCGGVNGASDSVCRNPAKNGEACGAPRPSLFKPRIHVARADSSALPTAMRSVAETASEEHRERLERRVAAARAAEAAVLAALPFRPVIDARSAALAASTRRKDSGSTHQALYSAGVKRMRAAALAAASLQPWHGCTFVPAVGGRGTAAAVDSSTPHHLHVRDGSADAFFTRLHAEAAAARARLEATRQRISTAPVVAPAPPRISHSLSAVPSLYDRALELAQRRSAAAAAADADAATAASTVHTRARSDALLAAMRRRALAGIFRLLVRSAGMSPEERGAEIDAQAAAAAVLLQLDPSFEGGDSNGRMQHPVDITSSDQRDVQRDSSESERDNKDIRAGNPQTLNEGDMLDVSTSVPVAPVAASVATNGRKTPAPTVEIGARRHTTARRKLPTVTSADLARLIAAVDAHGAAASTGGGDSGDEPGRASATDDGDDPDNRAMLLEAALEEAAVAEAGAMFLDAAAAWSGVLDPMLATVVDVALDRLQRRDDGGARVSFPAFCDALGAVLEGVGGGPSIYLMTRRERQTNRRGRSLPLVSRTARERDDDEQCTFAPAVDARSRALAEAARNASIGTTNSVPAGTFERMHADAARIATRAGHLATRLARAQLREYRGVHRVSTPGKHDAAAAFPPMPAITAHPTRAAAPSIPRNQPIGVTDNAASHDASPPPPLPIPPPLPTDKHVTMLPGATHDSTTPWRIPPPRQVDGYGYVADSRFRIDDASRMPLLEGVGPGVSFSKAHDATSAETLRASVAATTATPSDFAASAIVLDDASLAELGRRIDRLLVQPARAATT